MGVSVGRMRGTGGLGVRMNKDFMRKFGARLNKVLAGAADAASDITEQAAPYDPKSRHARGLTTFPPLHHRDSIIAGTFVPKHRAAERSRISLFGMRTTLVDAYFKSSSGRGYWLEKGTSGFNSSGEFTARNNRAERRQAAKIKGAVKAKRTVRPHTATKPKPHFSKGMAAARRYLKSNLKNIL